jgi:hypothetical protein
MDHRRQIRCHESCHAQTVDETSTVDKSALAPTRACLLILDGSASSHDRCGQEYAAEEGQGVFVVAGGYSAPLLEPVEAAFNGVALLVDCGVERGWAATD